jgi:hypothetical protein
MECGKWVTWLGVGEQRPRPHPDRAHIRSAHTLYHPASGRRTNGAEVNGVARALSHHAWRGGLLCRGGQEAGVLARRDAGRRRCSHAAARSRGWAGSERAGSGHGAALCFVARHLLLQRLELHLYQVQDLFLHSERQRLVLGGGQADEELWVFGTGDCQVSLPDTIVCV